MALVQAVPRNLEESARIFGLTPVELAASALIYAGSTSLFRGLPYSAIFSLMIGCGSAIVFFTLNRVCPPLHGLYWLLSKLRPPVVNVAKMKEN